MKWILFLSLLTGHCFAVSLTKYKSDSEGALTQSFNVEDEKAEYSKATNFFDPTPLDLRAGQFSVHAPVGLNVIVEKLMELEKKIIVVDQELKKRKTSFNEVAGKPGHKTIFLLNEYRILPESKYFPELQSVFSDLQKLNWTFVSGFSLSPDLSQVSTFKNGQFVKKESYNKDFYCRASTSSCTYIGGGQVFVKKIN